jgi:hypothetical protein
VRESGDAIDSRLVMNTSTRPLDVSSPELPLGLLAASASACSLKTRIGPSAVFGQTHTEPLPFVSHEAHRTSTDSWPETASDLGLYTQPDPIGITSNESGFRLFPARQVGPVALPSPGGNLFSYAEGSPTRLIDPTGEQAVAWALPAAGGCAIADGPLPVGDVIGAILLTGAVVYDAARERTCDSCESRGCRPCIPPVGTLAHRPMDTPARPQHGISGPHYNMYQMNQSPFPMCICFWRKLKAIPPPLPPGAMPIVPAGGGGPL